MTDTTLTMTWTLHLSEPMTDEEWDAVIGNIHQHILDEADAGIPGFAKIEEVTAPDGKYRVTSRDMGDVIASAFRQEGVPVVEARKDGKRP